jgi:hypothetical protein
MCISIPFPKKEINAMSRPVVLCFNVPADKVAKVRFGCMRLGVLVKSVDSADFTQPLGALCGLTPPLENASVPEVPFTGEVLLMAGLNRQQAERLLASLKQSRVNIPLKAVLTPTNAEWDCIRLHRELTEERAAIQSGQSNPHTAE